MSGITTSDATAILAAVIPLGIVLAVWLARRRLSAPERQIDKWVKEIRAGKMPDLSERTDFDHELLVKSESFIIREAKTKNELEIRWDEVQAATAFKRDLLTTDQVCIAFQLKRGAFEIDERMNNFTDFCAAMAENLPGSVPWTEWFMKITTPAFELCVMPIFERQQG